MMVIGRWADAPHSPLPVPRQCFVPEVRSGSWAAIGRKSRMEDAYVAVDDIVFPRGAVNLCKPQAFYGVFDGHGGAMAAEYLQRELLGKVTGDKAFPLDMPRALVNAFLRTDVDLWEEWSKGRMEGSGTTALAALVWGSTLYVANAGDCRAVISRLGTAVVITSDHRTASPSEKERVEAAGGTVVEEYLNGELAVTRALGNWHMEDLKRRTDDEDGACSSGPLIAEPEVYEADLQESDEFMVLACDGLWDAFPGQSQLVISEARKSLRKHNDPSMCSKELVELALSRDASDNITVVTVCFSRRPPVDLSWRACQNGRNPNSGMRRNLSVEALKKLQDSLLTS